MSDIELVKGSWYWLRQSDGSLAPYRFHRKKLINQRMMGEFYVGSLLTTWSLGNVVGKAEMPEKKMSRLRDSPACSNDKCFG